MLESEKKVLLERLQGFDGFVRNSMEDWKVPGVALSIVKDDALLYSKGYGMRDPKQGLEMNADTLYRIASNTMTPSIGDIVFTRSVGNYE